MLDHDRFADLLATWFIDADGNSHAIERSGVWGHCIGLSEVVDHTWLATVIDPVRSCICDRRRGILLNAVIFIVR